MQHQHRLEADGRTYHEAGQALWNAASPAVEDVAHSLKQIEVAFQSGEQERMNFHVQLSDLGELCRYVYDAKGVAEDILRNIEYAEEMIAKPCTPLAP